MKKKHVLGIDVGGSGIKGAIVNTKKGILKTERHRIETPSPATPKAVAEVIKQLVDHFKWEGPIGVGFPAAVQNGVAKTAANIHKSFINTDVNKLFSDATKCPVFTLNDADSAGMAEVKFGAGSGNKGSILLITVGTGLGTVFFTKQKLLPNTELGHIIMKGKDAEHYASDAVRKQEDLSWEQWAGRFTEYLNYLESLFYPDLIIIGGGVSKKPEKYWDHLKVNTKITTAQLKNEAGIVGAALYARKQMKEKG